MRKKILSFSALLAAFAVVLTAAFVTFAAYRDFLSSIQQEVSLQAVYIRSGIELSGLPYLQKLEANSQHRITVIDEEGDVLFDSVANPATMGNHLDRPEIKAALLQGQGQATRYSNTIRQQTFYYALRLDDNSVLRISSTTKSLIASFYDLFWLVAVIAFVVFILAFFIASLVTRRLVRPINEIDLDHPQQSPVYDELAPLLGRIHHQNELIGEQMQALDRQRAEFASITENMSEGFLVLDRDGKILSHNKSALRLLDCHGQKAVGKNALELNRNEPFRAALHSAFSGQAYTCILQLEGRDCQLHANPVIENDHLQGVVLVVVDITEKHQRDQLRREFTANVSHELKTPLTAISGYVELIMNGIARPEDVPGFAADAYREAQRMIALVRDLMLLSKLDEQVALPQHEVTELLSFAQGVADRLQVKAQKADIDLQVTGKSANIMALHVVLDEMITNLLDNAIQYNQPGGKVRVSIKPQGGQVILRIADTGVGIPKADQHRVFERFYRVDKSHSEKTPGTGLGLAIVKHGAFLHDARLTLESEPSKGTTMTLCFKAV